MRKRMVTTTPVHKNLKMFFHALGNQFLDSSPLVIDAEIYSSCDKLIKRVRDSVKKELKYK